MKEINNLCIKNEYFGEAEHAQLTQEMKYKALTLLMFMVTKRNGEINTHGCANGSYQRMHTDKHECSSPTPDFYTFKNICAIIAKESRDVATIDLPGFFLQTKMEGEERILLKLTGAVELLLFESNPTRWKKHLARENCKWILCVICDKTTHGTMNATLLSHKKLAQILKRWKMVMKPHDPCVWNTMIGEKQLTLMHHADDLII